MNISFLSKNEPSYCYSRKIDLEVDGGINHDTARQAILAGADVLVSGSYIFGNDDYKKAIEKLRG